MDQFENALGQFLLYLFALQRKDPDRILYLTVPDSFYFDFFEDHFFQELSEEYNLRMIAFHEPNRRKLIPDFASA